MRRALAALAVLTLLASWSPAEARAGIITDSLAVVKAKCYSLASKVQAIVPLPLPAIEAPCHNCGVPVPRIGLKRLLHKRTCVDPTRSPRDFFMLR